MDEQDGPTTDMVHFVCDHCHMSATMVSTEVGARAWHDHMDTHGPAALYRCWTWEVLALPFEHG